MLKRMSIDEIRAALLDMAKDREAMINGETDSIWVHDAQALYEAADLIDNSVPRDFHDHCMGLAVNRFIDAELKLAQAQATNRQTIGNDVPKGDSCWHDGGELPEKDGYYLVIGEGMVPPMQMLLYCKECGWLGWRILHWMPLPEMPEEAKA